MCLSFAYHYKRLKPVAMTWTLNVDGIHDLNPIQNKDCVLGVLRSKTKNISIQGVKSTPTYVRFYIQRLDPSTQHFRILVTTTKWYFSCPAKTDGYWHGWDDTSHLIFVISKVISRVFRRNNTIFSMLSMVFDYALLVPNSQAILNIHVVRKMPDILLPIYIWYRTVILLQVFGNLYQGFFCIKINCLSGHRSMYICVFVI